MRAIRSRRPKYDAAHPFDPDLSCALCYWCAVLFVDPRPNAWLKISKCPDCGGDDLRRLPFFTLPKYKQKWLAKQLVIIQTLAFQSARLKSHEKGYNRVIPPELIVKHGRRSQWHRGWEWTVISGPAWLGEAKDDPHRSKQESRIVRGTAMSSVLWTPGSMN